MARCLDDPEGDASEKGAASSAPTDSRLPDPLDASTPRPASLVPDVEGVDDDALETRVLLQ